jgi:hypothetical protein
MRRTNECRKYFIVEMGFVLLLADLHYPNVGFCILCLRRMAIEGSETNAYGTS